MYNRETAVTETKVGPKGQIGQRPVDWARRHKETLENKGEEEEKRGVKSGSTRASV